MDLDQWTEPSDAHKRFAEFLTSVVEGPKVQSVTRSLHFISAHRASTTGRKAVTDKLSWSTDATFVPSG